MEILRKLAVIVLGAAVLSGALSGVASAQQYPIVCALKATVPDPAAVVSEDTDVIVRGMPNVRFCPGLHAPSQVLHPVHPWFVAGPD